MCSHLLRHLGGFLRFTTCTETRRETQLTSAKASAVLPTLTTLWLYLAPSCNFISFLFIYFFKKRPLTFFLLLLESFGDSNVKPHVVLLTCTPTATHLPPTATPPPSSQTSSLSQASQGRCLLRCVQSGNE